MKIALPVITLVLCAVFLVTQQFSLSRAHEKNEDLDTRIKGAQVTQSKAPTQASPSGKANRPEHTRINKTTNTDNNIPDSVADIDLQSLAEMVQQAKGGGQVPNLRAMLKMQKLILEATGDELKDLIGRTAELDVSDEVKGNMLEEFVGALADHDPQAALEAAFNSEFLSFDEQSWRFGDIFSKWAKDDAGAAVAWFDREFAKGSFESKALDGGHDGLQQFQAAAIAGVLLDNPADAKARLQNISEDDRTSLLRNRRFRSLARSNPSEYATFVRDSVADEDQQARIFTSATRELVQHGYDEVSSFVTQIDATPTERTAIVEQAAHRKFERMGRQTDVPSAEDVSELQGFLQANSHPDPGRVTGESIGHFGGSNDKMEQALTLVGNLHQENGDDTLILGFMEVGRRISEDQQPQARELINRLKDSEQRETLLNNLSQTPRSQ